MQTSDIYAFTNPVFLAVNISEFLCEYQKKKGSCFLPISYIVAPIIFSEKIRKTLLHTNKRTGFLNWLYNNPELVMEISLMIKKTKQYTNKAILFGTQVDLISINDAGFLVANKKNSKLKIYGEADKEIIKYAQRLGEWLSNLDDEDVFYNLGVIL